MRTLVFAALLLLATTVRADRRDDAWVEKTLRSMSTDEKIGQLLVPNAGGGFKPVDGEAYQKLQRWVTEFHIGGAHVVGGEPPATALLVNDLQRLAKVPLLVTADLEGGAGYVFFGATRLPLAMAIGATGRDDLAYAAGKIAAQEGKALGIGVDFYPVTDVNNNPRNPIISIRSFGEDPQKVAQFSRAYIRGIHDGGLIATAKHFPGHGDVASDSHLEMPVLDVSRERLESLELIPFRAAIAEGVGAVMSAHIALPALEEDRDARTPATLSKRVLTDLLRRDLGFKGLIFTDAMDMHAISKNFPDAEATVRAVEAGADVVLFPRDVEVSFRAIQSAVGAGRIPVARLDDSVRRILRAKARLGLTRYRPADLGILSRVLGSSANRDVARKIHEGAITLVRDEQSAVPLRLEPQQRLLHVNLLDSRSGWREGPVGRVVTAELPKRHAQTVSIQLDDQSSRTEYELARKLASLNDAVVVTAFIRVASYKGSIDLSREQLAFLRDLASAKKPLVFVLFGSPYLLHHVPELPSYVLTYDTTPGAELAAVRAIAGEIPIRGVLPISLPGLYPIGHGLRR